MTILIQQPIKGFSVVAPGTQQSKPIDLKSSTQSDPDRRLVIKPTSNLARGSARWPRRPVMPDGNEAWTFKIQSSSDAGFYVTVGHYRNGNVHPFEVFANGDVPRGVAPLPWLLSRVMRSTDTRWLDRNLTTLSKVVSQPFDLTLPGGKVVRVGGPAAALAAVVRHRCEALGYLGDSDAISPMLDALMCSREPKSGASGCSTFSWDIRSQSTPDDGLVTVKEAVTSEGVRVPLSIWMSGSIEKDWDGFCKLLSLQMQVSDLELVSTTLLELENFHERNGEYGFADIPGSDKQRFYPSTIAYVASLLKSRYQALGLLDSEGHPVQQQGLFDREADWGHDLRAVDQQVSTVRIGSLCSSCGENAVQRLDNCSVCLSCTASSCG